MKFKATVIGLLSAILAVCCFTSYRLIKEAEKQTAFSKIAAYMSIETFDHEAGYSMYERDKAAADMLVTGARDKFREINDGSYRIN